MDVAEVFIDTAYYSVIVLIVTIILVVFIYSVLSFTECGKICCKNTINKLYENNFYRIPVSLLFLIFIGLEVLNVIIWVCLFFGPKIAKLLSSLVTVNIIADLTAKAIL